MDVGSRLRELREFKNLSQGDIEKRTGLLRCYISRVENGHTVPALETLKKIARALEVQLYDPFYGHEESSALSLSKSANRTRAGAQTIRDRIEPILKENVPQTIYI